MSIVLSRGLPWTCHNLTRTLPRTCNNLTYRFAAVNQAITANKENTSSNIVDQLMAPTQLNPNLSQINQNLNLKICQPAGGINPPAIPNLNTKQKHTLVDIFSGSNSSRRGGVSEKKKTAGRKAEDRKAVAVSSSQMITSFFKHVSA